MPPTSKSGEDSSLSLESITSAAVESVPEEPDVQTKLNEKEIQLDHLQAQVESFRQDMGERKKYALRIFGLTVAWVGGIYVLLLLQGFGRYGEYTFHLKDSVVMAAIGSTTANIVGVFLIVTRYFFPRTDAKKDKKKTKSRDPKKPVDSN